MSTEWKGEGALPILYSRTATGAVNIWQCWVENDQVCVRWGQIDGTMQESRVTCLPKNEGRSNATTGRQQAIKEAKSQWAKKKKKKYSESYDTAGKTDRIKPMLALDWKKRKGVLPFPVSMQPKLDGMRCLAYIKDGKAYLQTRGGDPILLPHILSELVSALAGEFVLDGELYIHGMSLQDIISLVKRPRPESVHLYYCVYDMFHLGAQKEATWDLRKSWLLTWFGDWQKGFHKVILLDTNLASSQADIEYLHLSYVQLGYEGGIIRLPQGVYYEDYRSPDLLKMKEWEDDEFRITGWTVGRGKFENQPVFSCLTKEGKQFEVVPKGSAEERYAMLQNAPNLVGQLLTVQYLGFTDEGKPRCARGVAIRDRSDMS